MGCADIVPGVSGGTMALVLGIYPKLISEISKLDHEIVLDLLKLRFKKILTRFDFSFLIPLLAGILSAIIIGAHSIHWLLAHYPEATWGFFLGLMIASAVIVRKGIDSFNRPLFFVSIVIALGIVNLVPFKTEPSNLWFFFSGSIAIIAMILPGISGAFLLLILGKYEQVTSAIKAPFDDGHGLIIVIFSLGCLAGLISFSKVLKKALSQYPSQTYSVLLGLIIGALYKLWPWKKAVLSETINGKEVVLASKNVLPSVWASGDFLVILLVIIGFLLVLFIDKKASARD